LSEYEQRDDGAADPTEGVEAKRTVLLRNWGDLEAIQPQSTGEAATNPYRRELGVREELVVLEY